ncbi:MAG: DNA topoisomerase 3 [Myxococcales bacterium]|nr:DNA topoisomerase 3 [Myxococcales bacterium]
MLSLDRRFGSVPTHHPPLEVPIRLIVTEKPSVARDIARVLGVRSRGQGCIEGPDVCITWCVGHLVELVAPQTYNPEWKSWRLDTLPMIPERFELSPRDGATDQWQVVKRLMRDKRMAEVVNACDAGREGELIFGYAYQLANCKRPVRRLWISSMTDAAIRKGFQTLRDGEKQRPLEDAARCRSEADWLIGLNATRAMTVRMRQGGGGALLSLGRVQTPTLAVLTEREDAIESFEPREYWHLKGTLTAEAGSWQGMWTRLDKRGQPLKPPRKGTEPADHEWPDRVWSRDEAESLLQRLKSGSKGEIRHVARREKRERAPLLYDLTSLQKEANRRFGFSAKRTLEIAQRLYEQHKVLTYPRTDSRHLSTDQVDGLPDVLRGVRFGPYEKAAGETLDKWPVKLSKRVVNDAEISDHHAIIPTGVDPRGARLDRDDKRLFDLVTRRFLAVFADDAVFATATIDARFPIADAPAEGPQEDCFLARGRTMLDPGWRTIDPPRSTKKELLLPAVNQGDATTLGGAKLHTGSTRPPPRLTEATLLAAMERAGEGLEDAELERAMKRNGLGTPATRASIIETLLSRRYIQRDGQHLLPTPQGRALIASLPIADLRSPRLTGQWEARLVAMAEGRESRDAFMDDVRTLTEKLVEAIATMTTDGAVARVLSPPEQGGEALGGCTRCNKGTVRALRFGWGCDSCGLRIPGQVASRQISPRMAKTLLNQGHTPVVKGFKSKKGSTFSAALKWQDDGRVGFDFPEPEAIGDCPVCKTAVSRRGRVWSCVTGRDCAFVVFGEMNSRQIPEQAVRALLQTGESELLDGFRDFNRDGGDKDQGPTWSGKLRLVDGRVRVVRVDARATSGAVGSCRNCKGPVSWDGRNWACACGFRIPGLLSRREIGAAEVSALLKDGRTPRLSGFRQRPTERHPDGAVFKAALVLSPGGVQFDYKAEDPAPKPKAGGPPHAFAKAKTCPACKSRAEREPGYVIAGRAAWGCAKWRAGCKLQVPFVVAGQRLDEDEAVRLFGKAAATRYLKNFEGSGGKTARVVLDVTRQPMWRLQIRGSKA